MGLRRPPTFVWVLSAAGAGWWLVHLEQVPETGRWRFLDTSVEMEKQMGKEALQQVLAEYQGRVLPDTHPTARYVQRVVKRLLLPLDDGNGRWQTFVIDAPVQNAFVIPGGKIFVFTGILPITATEGGLAVILGHEIAHQVARHSAEKLSYGKLLIVIGLLLSSLGIDEGISRSALNLFMTLPNSRTAESEADYIGLRIAARACYDPREAKALWERMEAAEGGKGGVDFLSTHPSPKHRVTAVTAWAEEMIRERPASCGPLEQEIGAFNSLTYPKKSFFGMT